ncbi:MAG: type II toxin-antitoxin system PemK/MazF family toxin [Sulfuricella sp.]|nr:type II toxin-antitoxin system PemK/MazF family toxin [Sulfuricella sp.]
MPEPDHGDVWLANLNPGRGTEPGKTRPVLIVQCQALLDAQHPSTLVLPLTTSLIDDAEPLRLRLTARGQLERDSDVLVDQLRALDNRRLISGPLASCDEVFMQQVYSALRQVMDIPGE